MKERKYIGSIQEYLEDERIVTSVYVADASKMHWDGSQRLQIDVNVISEKISNKHPEKVKIKKLELTHTTDDLYFIEVRVEDMDEEQKTYRFHLDSSEIEPVSRVFEDDDDADAFLAEFSET